MARLLDDGRLNAVNPTDLQDYLLSRGWQAERRISDRIAVWQQAEADAEVWVPLQQARADYRKALVGVFETLEEIEDREYAAILNDLRLVWADVLKICVNPAMIETDSIKLSEGVSLIERTRDMLLAAARAALAPRAVYSSRPPQPASEYLRRARLGQTEFGSYIVTVISPVAQEPLVAADLHGEPYTRQVTRTLSTSLEAAKRAAERALADAAMNSFDEAIQSGVSANLCEALSGLAQASIDNAVQVKFTWADRFRDEALRPKSVVLPSAVVATFRAAAQHLREREPEEEFETRGTVHRLQDVPEEPGVTIATLHGMVDGAPRSLKAQLSGANRANAIHAFEDRLEITATGTLDRRTAPYSLLDPLAIEIPFRGEQDEP